MLKFLQVRTLCNGDLDRNLKVECFDHNMNGNHSLIGEFFVTVRQLLEGPGPSNEHPCINPKKKVSQLLSLFNSRNSTNWPFLTIFVQNYGFIGHNFASKYEYWNSRIQMIQLSPNETTAWPFHEANWVLFKIVWFSVEVLLRPYPLEAYITLVWPFKGGMIFYL